MRNSTEILCKALAFGLFGALLAGDPAQAGPPPYSKTLTFTLSTTTPAPPAAPRTVYAPANTKYSTVQLQRAGTQVAVESLEIAHEGFRSATRQGTRPETIIIVVEEIKRVAK